MSEPGPTRVLAEFAALLELADVPDAVQAHARLCLLDGLGCGLYGSQLEWGQISAAVAEEMAGGGGATVWGHSAQVGPAAAALANGTSLHGFEIDDVHVRAMIHPAAVVIPAVLALAETEGADGETVLAAIIAGYEVGIRVGIATGVPHGARGYHATGTVGCIAAAAGAARVLGLDADQTAHAIGIAATQAAGLYCARAGAMTKRFHAGHAAQAGVLGAVLARRGFTGSTDVLEVAFGGFMSTLTENPDMNELTRDLGLRWETALVGFKIHAACASAHTIIDGLDDLMRQGVTAENLDHLTVHMTTKAARNVGWPYVPESIVAAQMNGRYAAAAKLLDGVVFAEQYAEDRLVAPDILALVERVDIIADPELDAGGVGKRHASRVAAVLNDGRTLSAFNEQRRGSSHRPLSQDEIIQKFRLVTARVLAPELADDLLDLVFTVEKLPEISLLTRLLRVPPMTTKED